MTQVMKLKVTLYAKLLYTNTKQILLNLSYYIVINNSRITTVLLHFFFRSAAHAMKSREIGLK